MPKTSTFRAQIIFILCLGFAWAAIFLGRPLWYHPWCAVSGACVADQVNRLDQFAFQFNSVTADYFSNLVQNAVGVFAFVAPWIWIRGNPKKSLFLSLFIASVTVANGLCLEIARALVQRPRPLVFRSPMIEGARIDQYTSFYSGHTSFVAAAMLATVLWMKREKLGASTWVIVAAYPIFAVLTASLRVIGGRHYPTDTVGGFIGGSLVAIAAFWLNRQFLRTKS